MKRATLYILVIIAAIALSGLIVVQGYWIQQAWSIKEQQFAQLVNTTINHITEDIQSYEVVQVINELDMPYPFQRNIKPSGNQKALLDTIIAGKKLLETPHPNVSEDDKFAFWNSAVRDYWKPHNIVQESFMQFNAQITETRANMQFNQSVKISSQALSPNERKARRKVLVEATIERLQRSNYNIEDRIEHDDLNYIIHSELAKSDIKIPFEYAVVGKECDQKIYQSEHYNPQKGNDVFVTTLFPFDWVESQPYYLNMYFPKQRNYLFHTVGMMGLSSVTLTLIVIFTFALTFYQIIKQKKLTAIRTDFVNNVTHELKTPISTISLASQMLNDKSIPNVSKNYDHLSTVIADESKRLSQQVEKILQMAIFDRGKVVLKFKELDLHELVNLAVRNMLIQIKNKNGHIVTNLNAENAIAEVDEVHFTNVLFNLMDNAAKYSKGSPEITVTTFNNHDKVCVSVKDNGIGISKAEQKRIFDRFYRVSTGNVHNVKGFGLGLAYVKNVVDSHHGNIQVDSDLGQGTCFTVSIPRQQIKN
ncbi:MAG: HAMP domain-containing histidine kinase [Bacteroidales bacterium]|jgi:two-component system phosphate regulon sensor histidine kinase PhoR|nr:HAMP domain-containing histidine kinase [Bacteroidales bacterium]